ncbi:MAG TPA: hypothetical protein VI758_05820 [Bacteroidota bacterium]
MIIARNCGTGSLLGIAVFFVEISMTCVAVSQQASPGHGILEITGGLGVSAIGDPSIVDYMNSVAELSPDQQLSEFTSAPEFFITPEVQFSDNWSIALEYSYMLKSYNSVGASQWDFTYTAQMPSILLHYLMPGEGYCLKYGGGLGYAFGKFTEQYPITGSELTSTASGPLVKIELVGNTEFDEHFWGSIGVDLRWVFAGVFKNSSVGTVASPKLNFFSAGLKFGVTYEL